MAVTNTFNGYQNQYMAMQSQPLQPYLGHFQTQSMNNLMLQDKSRSNHEHSLSLSSIQLPPPMNYQNQQFNYSNSILPRLSQQKFCNNSIELPPPVGYYPTTNNNNNTFSQSQNIILPPCGLLCNDNITQQQRLKQQDDKVNGGVSETLDYDLDLMAEFIIKTVYLIFGLDLNSLETNSSQLINDNSLNIKSSKNYELFLKGITSVLNATRLPSTTIFMALDYLLKYLNKLPNGSDSIGGTLINVIYQNTIVSFILANKFNDDKTFTNKSWAQATGMENTLINEYERNWLKIFNWKLFDDKFIFYNDFFNSFNQFCQEKKLSLQKNDFNGYGMINTPMSIPTPYFSSPSGITTPATTFGFQTPNLSSNNNKFFSSPCHYSNDEIITSQFNYNYRNQNRNQNQNQNQFNINSNIQTIRSSPISKNFSANEDSFNYDYYNFYDSKQQQQRPDNYWNRCDLTSRNFNNNYYVNYSTIY